MPRTTRERLTPWLFMGEGIGQLKAEGRETNKGFSLVKTPTITKHDSGRSIVKIFA